LYFVCTFFFFIRAHFAIGLWVVNFARK
jgi:hypothetical protein